MHQNVYIFKIKLEFMFVFIAGVILRIENIETIRIYRRLGAKGSYLPL